MFSQLLLWGFLHVCRRSRCDSLCVWNMRFMLTRACLLSELSIQSELIWPDVSVHSSRLAVNMPRPPAVAPQPSRMVYIAVCTLHHTSCQHGFHRHPHYTSRNGFPFSFFVCVFHWNESPFSRLHYYLGYASVCVYFCTPFCSLNYLISLYIQT